MTIEQYSNIIESYTYAVYEIESLIKLRHLRNFLNDLMDYETRKHTGNSQSYP